jgi:hypothetical protein
VTLDYDGPDRGEHCWWGGGCGMPGAPPPLPLPPGVELITERRGSGFLMRLYRLPRPQALFPQVAEGQYAVQQVPLD